MSVKDIFDSLKINLNQRFKSPFYGAFIISWLVFNWRPVLILFFSKKDINNVLDDLSEFNSFNNQFWYPVFLTAFIITVMPILNALYAYFDSLVGYFSDQGKGFKEILGKNKALKRKLSEQKKVKESEELLAQKNAGIAKLEKEEQDNILSREKIKQEIQDLPQVKNSINSLKLENESLKKKNEELLNDLKMALCQERDAKIPLAWLSSPHQKLNFWGEVNRMRALTKSRSQATEGE